MKNKFLFRIESLLHGIEDPKGPIEQVLFAQKVGKHEGLETCNLLALITFENHSINKAIPGANPKDETLFIGLEEMDKTVLHLCIRAGKSVCKIATGKKSRTSKTKVIIHQEYGDTIFLAKLSDDEINQLFAFAWENPDTIMPIL